MVPHHAPEADDDVERRRVPRQGVHIADPDIASGVTVPGHCHQPGRSIDTRAQSAAQASQFDSEPGPASHVEQPVPGIDTEPMVHSDILPAVARLAERRKIHRLTAPPLIHHRPLGKPVPGLVIAAPFATPGPPLSWSDRSAGRPQSAPAAGIASLARRAWMARRARLRWSGSAYRWKYQFAVSNPPPSSKASCRGSLPAGNCLCARGVLRRLLQGHPRRVQRVPARDRGSPARASGCRRGRRHRHPARRTRRGNRRRRAAQARSDRHAGGTARSPGNASQPTSIPAMSGWCARCPKAQPARSSTAKCSRQQTSFRADPTRRSGSSVVGDGEVGVAGGDDGAFRAAAAGDAPVTPGDESMGAGGADDDLAEGAADPGVAPASGAALLLAGGAVVDGGELGP